MLFMLINDFKNKWDVTMQGWIWKIPQLIFSFFVDKFAQFFIS